MTVIYVDVLLILNFMVNLMLLRVAALFATRSFSVGRAAAAAFLGALSALILFAPALPVAAMGLYKLACSAVMARVCFPFSGWRAFGTAVFCLFASGFIFSGLMLALYLLAGPAGMLLLNGIAYFDINAFALLLATAACYVVSAAFSALLRRNPAPEELCEVVIVTPRGVCALPALLDSGNSLTEPFSGMPAMVCGQSDLQRILPEGLDPSALDALSAREMGFRLIPYATVGGRGVLPAFVPLAIRVRTRGGETSACPGSYVAVAPGPVGTARYRAILNPSMLQPGGAVHAKPFERSPS